MTVENTEVHFSNPNLKNLPGHIKHCFDRGLPMVSGRRGRHKGQTALIVASGPSLNRYTAWERIRKEVRKGATVIGIKEAIRLLTEKRIPVAYSVQMDPGANQIAKLPIVKDAVYLTASSVHPAVFDYLLGADVAVEVYHSACGAQMTAVDGRKASEVDIYAYLWRDTWDGWIAQGGYDVTSRAVALAVYMGFSRILVIGADYGFRPGTEYYAKGCRGSAGNAQVDLCDDGAVDGKAWMTRPDLLASAVHMARLQKAGVIEILGDSLAKSLSRRDEEFWARCVGDKCSRWFADANSGVGLLAA